LVDRKAQIKNFLLKVNFLIAGRFLRWVSSPEGSYVVLECDFKGSEQTGFNKNVKALSTNPNPPHQYFTDNRAPFMQRRPSYPSEKENNFNREDVDTIQVREVRNSGYVLKERTSPI
jgi:hypothetical protein